MHTRAKWFGIAAVLWGLSGLGIGTSKADDVQVNTYTTDTQWDPSISHAADGDFVIAWHSTGSGGTDTSGFSVQAQRYASDGSPVGGEFQVNTYTTSIQASASVALEANGDFVIVWTSYGSSDTDTSNFSVQGQRYASDGSTVGGEFQVNTYTTGIQTRPSVSSDADGDFVVVWQSGPITDYSVQGQRYASDGSPVGGEFQVNTYTSDNQFSSSVSTDADGDFVVVWYSEGSSGTDTGASIQGQRYASDGSLAGGEFQINTYTTNRQSNPWVALEPNGDFVVVWLSEGSSGTDSDVQSVQGQRYASDGSPAGGEFQVNTYTSGSQGSPRISLDADGDFVVVWTSDGSSGTDTSLRSIQGQRYGSAGSPVGDEFQVNTYTSGRQLSPSVSLDPAGDFVVVWQSAGSGGTDTSSYSIQKSDAAPVPVELMSFAVE